MGIEFDDKMTEGSDTALASHTPTDVGTGWTLGEGAIQIIAASDFAESNNQGSGNRHGCDDEFSSADMDVQGDFRNPGGGNFVFWGPRARNPSAVTTGDAVVFFYDNNAGAYRLGSDTSTEAWGGDPTTMKLECRNGTNGCKGFADGVEKVSETNSSTTKYAGVLLGDFDGGAAGKVNVDNFKVSIPVVPLSPAVSAVALATISIVPIYVTTLASSSTALPTLSKLIKKTLGTVATVIPTIVKSVAKTLSTQANGLATLTESVILPVTLATTVGTGLAGLTTQQLGPVVVAIGGVTQIMDVTIIDRLD